MAAKRAEHVRGVICERPIETEIGAVPVSMSWGIAGSEQWPDLNAEKLINEADVALYHAKHGGRNRCVVAKPSGLQEVSGALAVEEQVTSTG
jgi:PleD family two-component response regulator